MVRNASKPTYFGSGHVLNYKFLENIYIQKCANSIGPISTKNKFTYNHYIISLPDIQTI